MSFNSTLRNTDVHSSYKSQISGLIVKETSIKVPNKYVDFADIFFLDLASESSKYIKINYHTIELIDS